MHLFDPPWISYEGGGIFSLDIHVDGKKLATAGQDKSGGGLLAIWDIDFVHAKDFSTRPFTEEDFGLLARIPHQTSLNCVRWSRLRKGNCLACSGDDPILYVYEHSGTFSSMGTLGSSSSTKVRKTPKNMENYRRIHKLIGHTMDVMHLDWSHDGRFLASSSLDNTVIIWNASKFPEKVTVLKESTGGHSRGVKGLAWDPIGRFLATQADDLLKIWQTDSWQCIRSIAEPFLEATGSTLFSRMDWSPDGSFLVAPCAMNNNGPTAHIILRNDWSYKKDLVGFRKATSCVRANSHCFQRTNSSGVRSTISCFAIGSRDQSLSLWLLPNFGRPLFVLNNAFKLSIMDLSWNNLTLAACSRDGAVKILRFSDTEIGDVLNAAEMGSHLDRLYGFRPSTYTSGEAVLGVKVGKCRNSSMASDFGYSFICDATGNNDEKSSEEIFGHIFRRTLPKKKISLGLLERVAANKNRQRKEPPSRDGDAPPVDGQSPAEFGQQNGARPKQDDSQNGKKRVVKAAAETNGAQQSKAAFSSSKNHAEVENEIPVQKRVFAVHIAGRRELTAGVSSVEVQNDWPRAIGSSAGEEDKVTRISGYLNIDENRTRERIWSFNTPKIVSLLAANSKWTILATFDAHLLVLTTQTGRLLSSISTEVLLKSLLLNGNQLNVEEIDGSAKAFNLVSMKVTKERSIRWMKGGIFESL